MIERYSLHDYLSDDFFEMMILMIALNHLLLLQYQTIDIS